MMNITSTMNVISQITFGGIPNWAIAILVTITLAWLMSNETKERAKVMLPTAILITSWGFQITAITIILFGIVLVLTLMLGAEYTEYEQTQS